jgi:serine/threonine protein phosphatase PrpC
MNHEASTTKKTFAGSLHQNNVHFAISTMRGRRPNQEDTFLIQTELPVGGSSTSQVLPNHALFAVFDGHGTSFASEYASEHFLSVFCNQKPFMEYSSIYLKKRADGRSRIGKASKICGLQSEEEKDMLLLHSAIRATMLTLDAKILEEMMSDSKYASKEALFDVSDAGTTAIIVMLTPNHIICANLGDSRAILHRISNEDNQQTTISLSTDHKPSIEAEEARIRKAGGIVLSGKIEARLAVSRGLGDFDFKHKPSVLAAAAILDQDEYPTNVDFIMPEDQMVSPILECTTLPRDDTNDKFLVLASDGIWDVLSNDKCSQLVTTIFSEGEQSVALTCEELLDQCYVRGSLDNMTAILVRFASQEIGCGGGVRKRRKQRKNT